MKKGFLVSTIIFFLSSCASTSGHSTPACSRNEPLSQCPAVQPVISRILQTQKTFKTRQEIESYLNTVKFNPRVITQKNNQPESKDTWEKYQASHVTSYRINKGVAFYKQHETVLKNIETRYKVNPFIIVATIGLESNYGAVLGTEPTLAALSNIAFYSSPLSERRYKLYVDNIVALFQYASKFKLSPTTDIQGSWAGAIGQPQFMPENVLKFAVKYDEKSNEKIDLNNNTNDVIASVANYYHLRGQWQYQQPVAELSQPKFLNSEIVFSEQFKKWLYPNFISIKRYNNSDWYAMAIYELSEAIKEGVNKNQARLIKKQIHVRNKKQHMLTA